jgi:hypothetical protein
MALFRRYAAGIGTLTLEPLDADRDSVLLHGWLTQPHARYWGMQQATVADVRAEYRRIGESPHHQAFLGRHDGAERFLVERYDPRHDPVAATYEPQPGDVGMHFLVAPAERRIGGFTAAVLRTVMDFLFSDPEVRRVVVEPDVRNTKVHRLNDLVGFERSAIVRLPGKRAWLSFCTRDQHDRALRMTEAG